MNRVVIVTGSRKGIGKALCEYFLSEGDIVYGCSRGESSINHPMYTHFSFDISNESSVVSMVKQINKERNRIDVLINNAGIAFMNLCLLTPYSTAKKIVDTNFLGTFLMCREVGKIMVRQKSGRIINYTSIAGPLRTKGEAVYAAAKAANEQFTKSFAAEMGQFNVTVNAIGPNPISTDLIKNVPEENIKRIIDQQSIKEYGTFEDILNVIKFYMAPESKFITGQVIYLGGIN